MCFAQKIKVMFTVGLSSCRVRVKIHKNPSKENKMAYKKQRNFCVSLRRKCMKNYLKKLREKGLTTNKSFWKFMKPFLTNKGFTGNNDITLIHQNKIISDEKQSTKLFNSYYINIVEKSSDTKTFGINFKNTSLQSVRDIVNSYKNHPSIIKIKQVVNGSNVSDSERFSFKTISESEIKDLLKNLHYSQKPSTRVLHKMFFQKTLKLHQ